MLEKNKHIVNELEQVAPILITAHVDTNLVFTIPVNYFRNLSSSILNAIAAENLKQSLNPYQVPIGYFSNLSSTILNKIASDNCIVSTIDSELQIIAPLLNTISKANIYSVPAGYFNALDLVQAQQPKAKIIALTSSKMWVKYAVAACLTGVLVAGAFMFNNKKGAVDYAAYKKIDVTNSINKLSSEELINYLDNVNSITNANFATTLDIKLPEIQDHIQLISDEELDQYLQEANLPLEKSDNKTGI